MSDFDKCVEIIFTLEGGYVNDPNDPGGETNLGICKRDYPELDIKNLTKDQAKPIYREKYWEAIRGDEIPYPLNLYLFDSAVNQGCDDKAGFATQKMLQEVLNIQQDGIMGRQTMSAISKSNIKWTGIQFMSRRSMRYTGTRNFDKYGRQWFNRLFHLMEMK